MLVVNRFSYFSYVSTFRSNFFALTRHNECVWFNVFTTFSDVGGRWQWCGNGAIWNSFTKVFNILSFFTNNLFQVYPILSLLKKQIIYVHIFMYVSV
ncbi:hypothetical protein HanRHA438_Chr02g0048091 [Helianthus annuus]|nr:hypothetical protein HanIR_Chr02g0052191 [Helianthus annuus]KAJ0938283.1 hypothetical protein HanRHA438_Chr02g0048091 [Helianthus annuus]